MKFKFKALVTAPPILPKIFNYINDFNKEGVEIILPPFKVIESVNERDLIDLLVDIDGFICGDDEINNSVLKKSKKLKVISKWGTGIDSIDSVTAKELGIKVFRVKDAFAEPVSDTVIAYVLQFCRNIIIKDKVVRDNKWEKVESYTLKEKSIGIIGLGHIGQVVAKKARALGMEVFGCDIKKSSSIQDIKIVSLDELLSKSDFITLHTDLNKNSFHLISQKQINLMKSNAVIINTSRGQVIDQSALEFSLMNNKISGAALDVFEEEPLPSNNILRKLDNVLLSPHNSNGSPEVFDYVDRESINNLFMGLNK